MSQTGEEFAAAIEREAATRAPSKDVGPLRGLLPFLTPHKARLVFAFIALIVAAVATLVIPLALRRVIDEGFSQANAEFIGVYFLAFLGVALVLGIATAFRLYLVTWMGERVVADIRMAVYSHLIHLSPAFFEKTKTGEVLSRLTTDTTLVQTVVGSSVSIALRNLFLLVGGLGMLIFTSPALAGMVLLVVPAVVVPIVLFGRLVRNLSRASQDRVADTSAHAGESLNAIRIVQAFTHETRDEAHYGEAVERSFQTAKRRIQVRATMGATIIFLALGAVIFVLWRGAEAVLAGEMTGGLLAQFVVYAILVASSAGALSEVWGELQRAAGATERLMELLNAPNTIEVADAPLALPQERTGAVTFDRVTFRYPARPDHAALDDFTLTVRPGETVALVGPSGAGKSTVFQLLLRFYDPDAGQVLVDGVAVDLLDPKELRSDMALVPQEVVVFGDTVGNNIRYGRPEATDDEVMEAARAAEALQFIDRLPQGFATDIGERGVTLSGGQRQRIAIARAILRDAPLLLLDEATSALDAESEALVQEALDHLMADRTTIVIAHRLATVKQADRIIVMDEGRIIAEGSHDDLVAEGGLYARLANLQFTGLDAAAE